MTDGDGSPVGAGTGETGSAGDGSRDAEWSDGGPAVEAEGLTWRAGGITVLEDVSLTAPAGTTTAVIGPNGSGKSSLLRLLAGLASPTAGTAAVRDDAGGRTVGFLPQRPAFRPTETVAETVRFYAALCGVAADVGDRLGRVGLADARDRRVSALSGGMVRLLGLAVATVGDPPAVLLDEPTSDLDPGMTARVFDAVDALAADGVAVLVATHDLAAIEGRADAVLLLDDGRVSHRGTPAELRAAADADSLVDTYGALIGGGVATAQARVAPEADGGGSP